MNFRDKIAGMMINFAKLNIPTNLYAPPLYRWLWSRHISLLPPIFQSIITRTSLFTIPFFLFGVIIFNWSFNSFDLRLIAPFVWFWLGLSFGFLKAKELKRNAKAIGIPSWKNYDPTKFVPLQRWELALVKGKLSNKK